MKKTNRFPCVVMRGGTSRALFFKEADLPAREYWDTVLLETMGSPDINQIDGLGGANSLTSKVAIIAPSSRSDADVDYTFAQVCLDAAAVHYTGNCGNISSAVGPFAVDEGLVPAVEPVTRVRVFNTNTGKVIEEEVAVSNSRFDPLGDTRIPGVPQPGSAVRMFFLNPEGAVSGKLLPTGNARDILKTSRGDVACSIVDAANPLVFVMAEAVGFTGRELPSDFSADDLRWLEELRSRAAELCGFAAWEKAAQDSPGVPKMTLIAGPLAYTTTGGEYAAATMMDLAVRMMSMQKPHRAVALTGAVCIGIAARTPGTLVEAAARQASPTALRIGHPGGIMEIPLEKTPDGTTKAGVVRTARRLMEGHIYSRTFFQAVP